MTRRPKTAASHDTQIFWTLLVTMAVLLAALHQHGIPRADARLRSPASEPTASLTLLASPKAAALLPLSAH
jgi:hypothetical protein